jgi:hypothetical protein
MNAPGRSSSPGRKSWASRNSGSLFVGGFGLVFAVAGALILFVALPAARERAALAATLPVVTPRSSAGLPAGTRVLLEAHIADDASAAFRDFVACWRREFRGWKQDGARRREQWRTIETLTPAISVTGDGQRLDLLNSDYEMSAAPHRWQSTESLEYSLTGPNTEVAEGFRRGDAVTVDGVLAQGTEGRAIHATALAGGSSAAYGESMRESATTLVIIGSVFLGVGSMLVVIPAIILARGRQAAA